MLPTLTFGNTSVSTYGLCVGVGLLVLLFGVILKLKHYNLLNTDAYYILPKLLVALIVAMAGAIIMDALLKIKENGGFKLSGMTFYGGLIAGVIALIILLLIFRNSKLKPIEWLDFLTVPFLLFHFFGRLGCFFGGCCYGIETNSPLGIVFPDQPDVGIFHYGHAVYPTQLFEAGGLLLLAIMIHFIPRYKFITYCYAYPVLRSIVEIWRGDNRGVFIGGLSPAQFTSVMIIIVVSISLICLIAWRKKDSRFQT